MYKLIATDLDGTLLDDFGNIPDVNAEYIQKAMAHGVTVALCSGRSYLSLNKFEERLGLSGRGGFGICFNGGIVYDAYNKEIISDIRMDRAVALEVVAEIKRVLNDPDVGIMIYSGADLYTERANENARFYAGRSAIRLEAVETFGALTENPSKVLLKGTNTSLTHIHEQMRGFIGGRCRMFFSSPELLEFIPLESGKARGLQILADRLGIYMSETIAVGDQVNDVDMLEAAGLGVAVANAVPEAKAAAGYIARSDNNAGVMKEIVEEFIFSSAEGVL